MAERSLEATIAKLRSSMEILLRFYKFKDWRVVEAKDDNGQTVKCLLLPMDRNGISVTAEEGLPYMRFCVHNATGKDGFVKTIRPMIPKSVHDELVEKGELDEDDVLWSETCGGIRPLLWASTVKKGYGGFRTTIDKFFGLKKEYNK